jgi:hypothetical protein
VGLGAKRNEPTLRQPDGADTNQAHTPKTTDTSPQISQSHFPEASPPQGCADAVNYILVPGIMDGGSGPDYRAVWPHTIRQSSLAYLHSEFTRIKRWHLVRSSCTPKPARFSFITKSFTCLQHAVLSSCVLFGFTFPVTGLAAHQLVL